jgi:hypothetical protein
MALQRVTVKLTQLRCLAQSEGSGGSEPYLWTTFFAFGAEQLPFQSGVFGVTTPSYDEFRTEFPNGIKAGSVAQVPVFIASGEFDMDLDSVPQPKIFGAIAVLMEEDSTPQRFMVQGRIAYSKEIEVQLEALGKARIFSGDFGPLTDAEAKALQDAVTDKVKSAVARGQNIGGLFRNQDDNLGFTFKTFTHHEGDPNTEIRNQSFDFPVIDNKKGDQFILSGTMSLGRVPRPPIVFCRAQRDALQAKRDQIHSLGNLVASQQAQLQHASPQAKPAIIDQIEATNAQIAAAEAELPALQAALDACLKIKVPGDVIIIDKDRVAEKG